MQRFLEAVRREWLTIVLVAVGFYVGRASVADEPPREALRSDAAFVQLEHGGTVLCRPVELLNKLLDDLVATPQDQSYLWDQHIINALPALAAIGDETCRLEGARALVAALNAYHKCQGEASYDDGFAAAKRGDQPFERDVYDRDTHRWLGDVVRHAGYLRSYAAASRAGL